MVGDQWQTNLELEPSLCGDTCVVRLAKIVEIRWTTIMRSICYLLLASAMPLLKVEASLAQELSVEDRACIVNAAAKLPNVRLRSSEAVRGRNRRPKHGVIRTFITSSSKSTSA